MSESGIVEQLRGNKRFRELFAEEKAKRPADADFCAILEKVEEILRNKGAAFDIAAKVQEKTIPQIFDGQHIMARAQTGAGKTYAFAIGMIGRINRSNNNVQAVCFAPTQELVKQIKKEVASLVEGMTPEIRVVDTSVTSDDVWKSMTRDKLPHIIVSTSGGLSAKLNHLTKGLKNSWTDIKRSLLGHVKLLVLDEADDMITESSYLMKSDLPTLKKDYGLNFEQVVCYSATYKPESVHQISAICKKSEGRSIKRLELPYAISPAIKQIVIKVKAENDKELTLQRKMEALKDIYRNNIVQKSIIFMNKKHDNARRMPGEVSIDSISREIEMLSNPAAGLDYKCGKFYSGMEDPSKPGSTSKLDENLYRDKVFTNFCKAKGQDGAFDVIITSDVLSRGIDLPEINLVINFDLPMGRDNTGKYSIDPITYIHRIGRCSRYGKIGTAITFIEDDNSGFEEIKRYCTSELIPRQTCEFNYDEVANEAQIGERVRGLITDFKSRAADVINEESKTDFLVLTEEPEEAKPVETNSTVFDPTVDAVTRDISNASIGGGSV